jgi:hypothetical protein
MAVRRSDRWVDGPAMKAYQPRGDCAAMPRRSRYPGVSAPGNTMTSGSRGCHASASCVRVRIARAGGGRLTLATRIVVWWLPSPTSGGWVGGGPAWASRRALSRIRPRPCEVLACSPSPSTTFPVTRSRRSSGRSWVRPPGPATRIWTGSRAVRVGQSRDAAGSWNEIRAYGTAVFVVAVPDRD